MLYTHNTFHNALGIKKSKALFEIVFCYVHKRISCFGHGSWGLTNSSTMSDVGQFFNEPQ